MSAKTEKASLEVKKMQDNGNKTLTAYRQGIMHERQQGKQHARNVIAAIGQAEETGLIQNVGDVIEIIRVEFDLIDER